jgi:hypothetical protein
MADSLSLTFEIFSGDEFLFKEQLSAESVTIGKGPAAMLRIEDDSLADLQAVINLSDEGTVQILDLVGSGTTVNGTEVVNAELASGDTIAVGEIKIIIGIDGDSVSAAPRGDDDEVTEGNVNTVGDVDLTHKTETEVLREDISEDVMAFIMRSGTSSSDVGLDRSKPPVLEVAEIWGDVIMDVKHFARGKSVNIGTSTGHRWYILGTPIAWVPPAFAKVAWAFPPTLSEAREEVRNDFYVPSENLPAEDFSLFQPAGQDFVCRFSDRWAGFIDIGDDSRRTLSEVISDGSAKQVSSGIYEIPVNDQTRVVLDIGHVIVFGQMVSQSKRVKGAVTLDYAFLAILAFVSFLGIMAGVLASQATLSGSDVNSLDERFVELLLQEDEPEQHRERDSQPEANPDAGEGAKAKKEEGKVGEKDAEMERAKGNKVEIEEMELDRDVAQNAGLMGQMNEMGGMDGIMGNSVVDDSMMGGIGGVLGARGTQMGSGGLGSRGSGMGGGGSASGLGGTGTRGRGGGSAGFGEGGGNFGPRGEGAIGRIGGDPIILGALDKSLIDRVIRQHMAQIRYCYQRQLNTTPTLNGKIVVKFVISGDGSVSQARTHSSTMDGGSPVEQCINERFLRFQFPEPRGGGIVIVKYPFIFSPQ